MNDKQVPLTDATKIHWLELEVQRLRSENAALLSRAAPPVQITDRPSELESVIACLLYDATKMFIENPFDEVAENMQKAADMLSRTAPPTQPTAQASTHGTFGSCPECDPKRYPFPERDASKPSEAQGVFRKFDVRRVDGSDEPGGKHYGCRYFVLDMDHDAHAPAALRAYADSCAGTHPQLAAELRNEFGPEVAQASAGPVELPPLPSDVLHAIWSYGDARADDGDSPSAIADLIVAISRFAHSQASAAPVVPGWVSVKDRLPDVADGEMNGFIVACRRAHNGKTYVFEALYLKNFLLSDVNSDDQERPFNGWHSAKEHRDYDGFYEPIDSNGDAVTHWMHKPAAQSVSADPLQELADQSQALDMGYGPNACSSCGKSASAAPVAQASAEPVQDKPPQGWDAEFLAMSYEGTAAVAGTILGTIAGKLERAASAASAAPVVPEGWIKDPDSIPQSVIKACRDAICKEFGNNGTDGYYKRILAKVFQAIAAAPKDPTK
jgi:hypothetical protein